MSAPPGGRTRQSGSSANRSLETPCCRCTPTVSRIPISPGSFARPRRSLRRRYTVDLTSQNLAFEKTDASVLGCGSSAVVYKGMLDNKPVAIKVRKARMPATLAAVQLKSCCCCRLSSSKGSPKLRARGSAFRLGVQISPQSVRERRMQVYKDMKSELAIMTKPKDPNVLVVYGVYVFRPRRPRGVGAMSSSSVAPIFAGRRRRRSCCSSPICGTAPHATSSTIGSVESRSRGLSCCIASSAHLSSASAALGCCA